MASAPFWIAMICQIVIVIGYFWFYRKEQLGMYYPLRPCVPELILVLQHDHDHDSNVQDWYLLDLYRTIHYLSGHFINRERTVTLLRTFVYMTRRILHHHTRFSFP